jgi:hypothetical protein
MKRLSNKALLVYSVMCLGVLIGATAQAASVNVGQVQGSGSVVGCVGGAQIPDLFVSLDTKGGPVLILINIPADMTADATLALRPTIDGQIPDPNTADYVISGSGRVGVRTLSYSRVFNVAKGAHVFGVVIAQCVGNFVSIETGPAWLTVYELP